MSTKKIVLPKDVFDTAEFIAEVYGGIGAGSYREYNLKTGSAPRCAIGIGEEAGKETQQCSCGDVECTLGTAVWPVVVAMRSAGLNEQVSDRIVRRVNLRKGFRLDDRDRRVSWQEFVVAGNVVRGD